jgi:hypothetical protein
MKVILDTCETMVAMGERLIPVIEGQFTKEDYDNLCKGLCQIAMKIPTTIRGKTLGHAGLVIPEREYITRSESEGAATFDIPMHPGAVPENLSADLIEREGQFAEHKFLIQEYETCMESKWV